MACKECVQWLDSFGCTVGCEEEQTGGQACREYENKKEWEEITREDV